MHSPCAWKPLPRRQPPGQLPGQCPWSLPIPRALLQAEGGQGWGPCWCEVTSAGTPHRPSPWWGIRVTSRAPRRVGRGPRGPLGPSRNLQKLPEGGERLRGSSSWILGGRSWPWGLTEGSPGGKRWALEAAAPGPPGQSSGARPRGSWDLVEPWTKLRDAFGSTQAALASTKSTSTKSTASRSLQRRNPAGGRKLQPPSQTTGHSSGQRL